MRRFLDQWMIPVIVGIAVGSDVLLFFKIRDPHFASFIPWPVLLLATPVAVLVVIMLRNRQVRRQVQS